MPSSTVVSQTFSMAAPMLNTRVERRELPGPVLGAVEHDTEQQRRAGDEPAVLLAERLRNPRGAFMSFWPRCGEHLAGEGAQRRGQLVEQHAVRVASISASLNRKYGL